MSEMVRVHIKESGTDITTTAEYAEAVGLDVLDKPAVTTSGVPLPPRPHRPLGTKSSPAQKGTGRAAKAKSTTEANKEA